MPFNPFGDAAKALAKLPKAVAEDWVNRGIFIEDPEADNGEGAPPTYAPCWQLRSTYWWRSAFPANKDVKVSHRYKPSVGGTSR